MTLAATAGLLGVSPRRAAAEPLPETTRLRLAYDPVLCFAPQFVADELLRLEPREFPVRRPAPFRRMCA